MSVTIKIYFSLPSGKQEIRRFTTDASEILPALLSFLHATYSPHYQPPLKFAIAYDDDEDLIAVNSEAELREGLSLHGASGAGGVFKLFCSFDQSGALGLASPSGLASGTSTPASLSGLPTFPASPSASVSAPAQAEPELSAPIVTEPTDADADADPDADRDADQADDGELVGGSDSDGEYVRLEADEPLWAHASTEPHPLAASEGSQSASQTLVKDLFLEPEPVADSAGAASAPPVAEPEVDEPEAEAEAEPSAAAAAVTVEDVTAGDETETADAEPEPELEDQPQTPVAQPETPQSKAEEAQAESSPSPAPVAPQQRPAAVHPHVICDGCSQNPITGTRFHCRSCRVPGGYDLCAGCHEHSGAFHPSSHSFVAYATAEEAAADESGSDAFTPEQQDCIDMLQALSAKITRVMDSAAAEEAQAQAPQSAASSSSSQSPASSSSASQSASATASASSSAAPSSSSSSSCSSGPLAVHRGISCDGCGQSPLLGNRYHCTSKECAVPGGFDLCEPCEESGSKHPASHVMLKMRVPGPAAAFTRGGRRHGHCPFRPAAAGAAAAERPKAEFVSDVTVSDGLQVHAGETLRKVWSVRNSGPSAWPAGTRLVFAGGDLAPESEGRADAHGALVPFAGPGDLVHVAVDIVVPQEAGRFRATFRLQTADGIRFGPRIWIDLTVPEEQTPKAEPEPEAEAPRSGPSPAVARPEPVAVALPVAVPVSASTVAAPVRVAAPERAAAAAESKQAEEEAALAAELAAVHIAAVSAAGPAAGSGSSSAPAPSSISSAASSFAYSNQLAVLRGMGFADRELCKYLLLNNRGDLEKVVTWLLANAKA